MSLPEITTAPDAPQPTDAPAVFNAKAFAFIAWLATLSGQLNTLSNAYEAFLNASFGATSTTSLAISTGSKAFTIGEGAAFVIGQPVKATSAANVANWMAGTIASYSGGVLTIDVTDTGGSGTHADWAIGLLPLADLSGYLELAGGTMIGALITLASATGGAGLRLPHGAAPSSPVNGDIWTTAAALFAQINGATKQMMPVDGTLKGYKETVYAITDGAGFEIDPANGSIQTVTLGASRTPKATNMADGQSITLGVDDGSAYTLTWTDTTFGASGVNWVDGNTPSLATSGLTWITLWKVGGQVYGSSPGATS